MATKVLNATIALSRYKNNMGDYAKSYAIKINIVGENQEYYVKDLLTGEFYRSERERDLAYSNHYSYLGNQNNAVDAIAKFGDAFEIKKVESRKGSQTVGKIALNNSPPKDVLHSDDQRLRSDVKGIDGGNWKQKDIFYAVGSTIGQKVRYLYFVQGTCYAARNEVYQSVFDNVRKRIQDTVKLSGLEFMDTKELGRIHRVDPLGITDFRLRGMWEIRNPADVFSGIAPIDSKPEFTCFAIMEQQKFLEESSKRSSVYGNFSEEIEGGPVSLENVKVKDPNNPAKLKDAVSIKVSW